MMRDRGFWVGGGASGEEEELKGMLGFSEPGWLPGVELELLGGRDGPVETITFKVGCIVYIFCVYIIDIYFTHTYIIIIIIMMIITVHYFIIIL